MVTELYISGVIGLKFIEVPELANVTILAFAKQGMIHTEVTSTPTPGQFKYTNTGRIDFGTEVEYDIYTYGEFSTYQPEKLHIIYKV